MSKAKLSSKGQLTIPVDVRNRLGLKKGDWVVFESTDRGVLLRTPAEVIEDLYGSLPLPKMPWKKMRELAWQKRVDEIMRRSSATRTSSSDS